MQHANEWIFFIFFFLEYDVAGPHEYPLSLHKHVHAVGGEDRDQIVGREGKKVGAGESKISGCKDKFCGKGREGKTISQACLDMKSKFASLCFNAPAPVWKPNAAAASARRSSLQRARRDFTVTGAPPTGQNAPPHHQTLDSSPALMCAERLVTCIQLQHAHLNSLDLFSV